MNETKDIIKPIIRALLLMGIPAYRMNAGSYKLESGGFVSGHASGTPDVMIGYPSPHGHLLAWIECKQPNGLLSWNQIKFLRDAHKKNIPWVIACSWDDISKWLEDKNYHGSDRFTRCVLDLNYQHATPRLRTIKRKPSPWDGLIEENNKRVSEARSSNDEPPF